MNPYYEIPRKAIDLLSSDQGTVMAAVIHVMKVSNDSFIEEIYKWVDFTTKLSPNDGSALMSSDQRLNELCRALYYYRTGIRIEMLKDEDL